MYKRKLFNPQSEDPFKFSRSKLELFLQCPRCFYLDLRLGVKRPSSFPFTLNNAVDALFKSEFDIYREKGEPHPLMVEYEIDAIPFKHDDLERWRHTFTGIEYKDDESNIILFGGIDDVWINNSKELHIVDYKATSKLTEVTLDADWQRTYKNQAEIYQWLFEKNGFDVSSIAYFVYTNADKTRGVFEDRLEFNTKIIPYDGDTGWVSSELLKAKRCLESNDIPKEGAICEYCPYRENAGNSFKDHILNNKK